MMRWPEVSAPIEHLLAKTFSDVKLAYIERVNNTYAECLVATLVIIVYLHYKLKFWAWQGIPNDITSLVSRLRQPFHVADNDSYKKYGKVVGLVDGVRRC